jgi:hypothetical protein
MSDAEFGVKITADASGVAAATNHAKNEFEALNGAVHRMGSGMSSVAGEATKATDKLRLGLRSAIPEVDKLGDASRRGFRDIVNGANAGAESINGIKASIAGFAGAFATAFAVDRIFTWVSAFGDAKEKAENLAQTFGITTNEVELLNAIAKTTGMELGNITKAMQTLDKNTISAKEGNTALANAFKSVGISAGDGRTQMERMAVIADKFKDMPDGPNKVALAMLLMGKNGASMIPILNGGSEALKAMSDEAARFDAASTPVADRAQEIGVAVDNALDTTTVAFMGVNNVLGDALGPVIVKMVDSFNDLVEQFIASYNAGGIVAQVFTAIVEVVEIVGAVLDGLGAIFGVVWDIVSDVMTQIGQTVADIFGVSVPTHARTAEAELNVLKDVVVILKDGVVTAVTIIGAFLQVGIASLETFGKVAWDALTLNWSAIDADWKAGMDKVAGYVEKATVRVKAAAAEAAAAMAAAGRGEALPQVEEKGMKRTSGSGDFDPELGATKTSTTKKTDSRVAEWKQQLSDMLLDEKNWSADSNLLTLDFWQKKLATEKLSGKALLDVQREVSRAKMALYKEEQSASVASIKAMEAASLDNAKTEIALAKLEVQEKLDNIAELEKAGTLSEAKAVQARVALNAQLLGLDAKLEADEHKLKAKALTDEIQLNGTTVAHRAALNARLLALEAQHLNKMRLLKQQEKVAALKAEGEKSAASMKYYQQGIQAFAQNMGKLLTFQQGIITSVKGLFTALQGIVGEVFSQIVARMVTDWLVAHGVMKALDKLFGISGVATSAAQAGAAAVASTAAIPIVGPALAPAAGAAAAASAMSFGALLSASGGFGDVPEDGTITELHRREMVLPADIATPLRDMLTKPSAGGGNGKGSGMVGGAPQQGDVHLHVHALDSQDVRRFLTRHQSAVAASLKGAFRDGVR